MPLIASCLIADCVNPYSLGGASASAAMNNKKSSDMPMPPGLLPVGNMQKMTINPGTSAAAVSGIPKPQGAGMPRPQGGSLFGDSAGVRALQSQYDPMTWDEFFADR